MTVQKRNVRDLSAADYEAAAARKISQAVGSIPTQTKRIASTDTAQGFDAADLVDAFESRVVAALVTFEGDDIRVAFGGTEPTQGVSGVGHLMADGGSIYLEGPEEVNSFQFISAVAATPGVVQVTFKTVR